MDSPGLSAEFEAAMSCVSSRAPRGSVSTGKFHGEWEDVLDPAGESHRRLAGIHLKRTDRQTDQIGL